MTEEEVQDPRVRVRQLAAESEGPTGWFERLYVEADHGTAQVPWDKGEPHQLLTRWVEQRRPRGEGRTAVVVGCGYGRDAEYVARQGFQTTAFDISPSAVRAAAERHAGSPVRYATADLLALPEDWRGAYQLVVESMTVQSMPRTVRPAAIEGVTRLVAPGGTLLVVAAAGIPDHDGPPWPLTRAEIDAFAAGELKAVHIEEVFDADEPGVSRWLAELHRPPAGT
ncbi:MAG: class I SAM-dependent methyltransferase [Micromonosporaceae bacterium]